MGVEISYTISARGKEPDMPVSAFLEQNYASIDRSHIDSLFGFVEKSTLYGGRMFVHPELTDSDVEQLYGMEIGLRIPFTNHYVEQVEYELNAVILDKYHRAGNSVIITNDKLAEWVRHDFPEYRIEASVIKNITHYDKIDRALELYDTVILPMRMNQDHEFLQGVQNKDRITLFANAGCALTCPSKICYVSVSKFNKFKGGEFRCSQLIKPRSMLGMIDFDLDELVELGFSRFKLLRGQAGGVTGY